MRIPPGQNLKTRPRDYQKWIRSVRFTPRGSEKRALGCFMQCRSKMSKIDLGSIKNGSAASDLPPEGSKKKSWADLTHLEHFAKTKPRDYQKWIRSVRFTPRGSEKKELGRFDAFGAFRKN